MIYFKGKIVGEAKYFHRSAIELLDPNEQELVQHACHYVANDFDWNVIKIDLKDKNKVSFLNYEDFEVVFCTAKSCQVSTKTGGHQKLFRRQPSNSSLKRTSSSAE